MTRTPLLSAAFLAVTAVCAPAATAAPAAPASLTATTPGLRSTPAIREQVRAIIIEEALRSGKVPPALALAVAREESNFNPAALSNVGARGVMQIMPRTAKGEFGVDADALWDARTNVRLGVTYLARLHRQYGGRWDAALSHYNGGTLRKDANGQYVVHGYTATYVSRVTSRWNAYEADPEVLAALARRPGASVATAETDLLGDAPRASVAVASAAPPAVGPGQAVAVTGARLTAPIQVLEARAAGRPDVRPAAQPAPRVVAYRANVASAPAPAPEPAAQPRFEAPAELAAPPEPLRREPAPPTAQPRQAAPVDAGVAIASVGYETAQPDRPSGLRDEMARARLSFREALGEQSGRYN